MGIVELCYFCQEKPVTLTEIIPVRRKGTEESGLVLLIMCEVCLKTYSLRPDGKIVVDGLIV